MKLYMKVTKDVYELPIAVAETPGELADMLGVTKNSILSAITHKAGGYLRINVEDDLIGKPIQ